MKIKQYKLEKIEVASKEVILPEIPVYYFETGVRRSVRIIPKFTTWLVEQGKPKEEIYQYDVTMVYLCFKCNISKFEIGVHQIETIYNDSLKSNSRSEVDSIIEFFIDNDYYNLRTKEEFEVDLKTAIDKINNID